MDTTVTTVLIDGAKKDAANKRNDWPGTPVSQIPLSFAADMRALVGEGRLAIVERPSKTRPDRMVSYVVATDA